MWKSMCSKKTDPSIFAPLLWILQPPCALLLMLPVKPDFMLREFQMKMLSDNKKSL